MTPPTIDVEREQHADADLDLRLISAELRLLPDPGWTHYVNSLQLTNHGADPERIKVLEALRDTLRKIEEIASMSFQESLVIAGCTSTPQQEPHETAPVTALRKVGARLFRLQELAVMVHDRLAAYPRVSKAERPDLTGLLLDWSRGKRTALDALRGEDWEGAEALAAEAVDTVVTLVRIVAESSELLEGRDVADVLIADGVPQRRAFELIGAVHRAKVLALASGTGLLILPAI